MRIVAGLFKNRLIKSPKGTATRPTSEKLRAAFFNMTQHQMEGAVLLDLFAGSGAIGLEALSRGAANVVFVDSSREAVQCIKENLSILQIADKGEVRQGDVFAILERLAKQGRHFDIIYADPPYEAETFFQGQKMSFSQKLLHVLAASPLLKKEGMLFIEDSAKSLGTVQNMGDLALISSRQFGRSTLHQYIQGQGHGHASG